uniref:N-lysine methyltransferase KMT5A-A-like n=1 Tax=Styela clava TaxID=7725 RepID=UPI00193999E1|nr:N-lysine methyltransferase KMT5A-A-like [Styela clava]
MVIMSIKGETSSDVLPTNENESSNVSGNFIDTSQQLNTPSKKRHVIKSKHIKTAKLDCDVKNSPLSKSIGLIEKFRTQGRNKKKSTSKEASSLAVDNISQEKSSDSSDLQLTVSHNKEDASPKKISKQNTIDKSELSINALENGSESSKNLFPSSLIPSEGEEKKAVKIQKSTQNTTRKKKTKNSSKPSVRSHVLTDYYPVRRSSRKPKSLLQKEHEDVIIEAIKSNCEDGLEVVEFESKGRGVIAKKAFKKGNFIVEYAGDLIDWNEAKQREDKYAKDATVGCYMYYFIFDNTNYCVDATVESGRLGRLLNHSRKNPNCKTKLVSMPGVKSNAGPRLVIVAKRDINAGEELTYDYGDRDKETLQSHPWLKAT